MTKTKEIATAYGDNLKELETYVSNEDNKRLYLVLVSEQVLGRDRNGNLRPFVDLALLMYYSKKTGLDPLSRQIYGVYRWDSRLGKEKMTIQTGIDGLRAVAERTGLYAGSDDITYEESKDQKYPKSATATVKRINKESGDIVETKATARWEEYKQTDKKGQLMGMWPKMPYLMLGKCAEALALRKAFPLEMSGLYTAEEMGNDVIDIKLPEPENTVEIKKLDKVENKLKERK